MTEATLTADIRIVKSQLETEIVKYQSEIYLRQAKIHALDVFGNSDTVQNWLEEKNPALDGFTPAELLDIAILNENLSALFSFSALSAPLRLKLLVFQY